MYKSGIGRVFPEDNTIDKSCTSMSPLKPKTLTSSDQGFSNLNESRATSLQPQTEMMKKLIQFKVRMDSKGVPIVKGSKNHKIRFKKIITQVIIVENWKIYNFGTEEDERTCPACLIQ